MIDQGDIGDIKKLLEIMVRLRDPERGCPWDREQTFATIVPYTLEEAYEVADAVERGALGELAVELGDLLLQVVYHARMAEEMGAFTFADVTRHICEKMIRRHPHVFGGTEALGDAAEQTESWEAIKEAEKGTKGEDGSDKSVLADIPLGLPALTRAVKLGRRASRVGFDWPDISGARAKLDEELAELDEAVAAGVRKRTEAEIGDVLFAVANLCRHLDADPEQCARGTNRRFEKRFRYVEQRVRESGRSWEEHALAELDGYWEEAKLYRE